jgi:hypothetical protein
VPLAELPPLPPPSLPAVCGYACVCV